MKKVIAIILVITFLFALTACGASKQTAEEYVTEVFSEIQGADAEKLAEISGQDFDELFTDNAEFTNQLVGALTKNISFEVVEATEEEDTAQVKVNITNIDMEVVMTEYLVQIFTMAFEYADMPEDQMPSDEDLNKMFSDKLIELIGAETKTVTNTVVINLTYNDGWSFESTPELTDALLGGLVSFMSEVEASYQE